MAKRRGRPSKVLQEQILKQDAGMIAEHFLRYPLRQPVEPEFDPYYRRILTGDLAALSDYCERNTTFDGSFYELIGRLVPLRHFGATEQIISEIQRGSAEFDSGRGGGLTLPDWVIYQHWYDLLEKHCQVACQFIRGKYKADPSAKREELWHEYCDAHFATIPTAGNPQSELKTVEDFKIWGEAEYAKSGQTPRRRGDALYDLVEKFLLHHIVPRHVFFELAESNRRSDVRADRDKRYCHRRFVSTPSLVARKCACAMVGLSPSSVSHQKIGAK